MERADSVRLLKINKNILNSDSLATNKSAANEKPHDSTYTDDNDDEVREITGRQENQGSSYVSTSNMKPGMLPDIQTTAQNNKLNLGLPEHGTFLDPHDGQRESPAGKKTGFVSTQENLPSTDTLHRSVSGNDSASFEPTNASGVEYSSALVDQQAAKSVGKEQI